MFKRISLLTAAALAIGLTACYSPARDVKTVIITGNYQKPRLLADVLQNESNQPYILVPNEAEPRIMFVPGKRTGKPSCEIPPHKFAHRIGLLNPKQIIILGDENYVPKKYEEALAQTSIPVVRMRNNDWKRIANSCQSMMNLSHSGRDFDKSFDALLKRPTNTSGGVLMSDETNVTSNFSEPGVVLEAPKVKVEESREVKPIVEIKEEITPVFPEEEIIQK